MNKELSQEFIDDKVFFNTIILPILGYLFFGKLVGFSIAIFFAMCYTVFSKWIFDDNEELRIYKLESFFLVASYFYTFMILIYIL